jgi:hypothetical protein
MKCNYCKFKGHTEDYCRRKKRDGEGGQLEVLMAQEEPEENSWKFLSLQMRKKRDLGDGKGTSWTILGWRFRSILPHD